jgi:V/A-type H+-transporting ATPase subunit I
LKRSLEHLRAWAVDAEPVIQQLQRGEAERAELAAVAVLVTIGERDRLRAAGRGVLHARLFVPARQRARAPPGTLAHRRPRRNDALRARRADRRRWRRGAGLAQQAALKAGSTTRRVAAVDAEETERYIAPRLDALAREESLHELGNSYARHDLATALSDAARLQWVIQNVRALESGDLFCWITGWTSDFEGIRLALALEHSGARALLHFPPPAPKARAPLLLDNPLWARPFEIFSRALGMPSSNEADPSVLLAIAVPLMFGYMFGDLGQGLVVAAAGFAMRKRYPMRGSSLPVELAAAVFGILFGSVFGIHAFDAVWIPPLYDPLTILGRSARRRRSAPHGRACVETRSRPGGAASSRPDHDRRRLCRGLYRVARPDSFIRRDSSSPLPGPWFSVRATRCTPAASPRC